MIESKTASILFCGDYHASYQHNTILLNEIIAGKSRIVFRNIEEQLLTADIRCVNIEYPITSSEGTTPKFGPHAKSSPCNLEPLKSAGFNLASIATNHIMDYGVTGLNDTIRHCREYGLETVGAGFDLRQARKYYSKEIKGIKIAILNFADAQFSAANAHTGGANPLDVIANTEDIRLALAEHEFVFLTVHIGADLCHIPSPGMVRLMRYFASLGVHGIVCHHSRYISGYEVYQGVPIFYGLGNIFHAVKSNEYKEHVGMMVKYQAGKGRVNYEIQYVKLDQSNCVIPAESCDLEYIVAVNKEVNELLTEEALHRARWEQVIRDRYRIQYLTLIRGYPYVFYKLARKAGMLGILSKLLAIGKKHYLPIWNMINSQVHSEIASQVIDNLLGISKY